MWSEASERYAGRAAALMLAGASLFSCEGQQAPSRRAESVPLPAEVDTPNPPCASAEAEVERLRTRVAQLEAQLTAMAKQVMKERESSKAELDRYRKGLEGAVGQLN